MNEFISQIDEVRWKLSEEAKPEMKVPGFIYADSMIMESALQDKSIQQVANVACLPGIKDFSFAMPDIHQGYGFTIGGVAGPLRYVIIGAGTRYGFTIGGVAAFDLEEGIISPGGVGYDISCGVRLLVSDISKEEAQSVIEKLASALHAKVPSGVGSTVHRKLSMEELLAVLQQGARWTAEKGMATPLDLEVIENKGCYEDADPAAVSQRALKRGLNQLGTLGSGNHFIEVQIVDEIFDSPSASVMGLKEGTIAVMVHCGSRGLGHQVCDDNIRIMNKAMDRYGIEVPDRQLCSVPIQSREGKDYMKAMYSAANFALANRQVITHNIRDVFDDFFPGRDLRLLYDVSHNMAQIEDHPGEAGSSRRVCVHRKGATRSLPPGHELLPDKYRNIGQPVFVPGSMGTSSYILAGTARAEEECFASTCHGAGRAMSRREARAGTDARTLREELESKGITIKADSRATLLEEKPEAYKDVEKVINVVEKAGISRKIARVRPLAVIKG